MTLADNDTFRYYQFVEKTKNKPLFIGRIDKFNSRLAVEAQSDDEVVLMEGGEFAFVSDEDYTVIDDKRENGHYPSDHLPIVCSLVIE